MQFRVLGPVEAQGGDGQLVSLRRQERCLLGILLLDAGRVVSTERLCGLLWENNPPDNARRAIQVLVARVRSRIGGVLRSRGDGYSLEVPADAIDASQFRTLVDGARDAEDPAERDRLLRSALALWRGPALQDACGESLRQRLCQDLDELRLYAIEESFVARLALGRHAELISELARLSTDYPTRERLVELHMVALYRNGRAAEALEVYADTRARLVDQLGIEPGPTLQALHRSILRRDSLPAPKLPQTRSPKPAQLPPDTAGFAGRVAHLRQLDAAASASHGTVVVSAVAGTAGVGKTALAVHWAHANADRFPDGHLYINLRGFDRGNSVVTPAEAVRRFLDAMQVPADRIPAGLDAQVDLYRSLLAGKRMLILLDNARDTAQLRPLLPGAPGCLIVVTSRNQLTSLIAETGARPVTLDLFTADEARHLLANRLGTDRTAAEPDATQEIIVRCARLPLALTLVAAHAAIRPQIRLRAVADQLRDSQHRWQFLTGDDEGSDVRTVFSWSYERLTSAAAQLFRLLGAHPGPDIGTCAAASLAALPVEEVQPLLAELTRANLVTEHTPGRYTLHDLLRAYATELADEVDTDEERRAATHRLLDHYLHAAYAADRLLYPTQGTITLAAPQPGVTLPRLTDEQQAQNWFTTERRALVAAVDTAATGFATHAWQIAWTLRVFLDRRGHWDDWAAVGRAAVAATRQLADPNAQAQAHRLLAFAYIRLVRFGDAHIQLRHALGLYQTAGDRIGQADAYHTLSYLYERRGQPEQALDNACRALNLYQAAGHRSGQARALNAVGWCHSLLGDHQQALTYCRQALPLLQDLDDRDGQAYTWDSLGYTYHHLGEHAEATACYQRALTLYRDIGNRYYVANTLAKLGDSYHSAGNPVAGHAAVNHALSILTDLGHPEAEKVKERLREMDSARTAERKSAVIGCPGEPGQR